jgi:drug/metabolite transporter (DMT)-like permease
MRLRDLIDLISLAALWGASFLFMRIAAPAFGPLALIELRVAIAAVFLLFVLAMSGKLATLKSDAGAMAWVGVINSAIPFTLLAYATLSVTAGFAAILNATSPLWAAVVALLWLGTRISGWRTMGLILGFAGVIVLVWGTASFKPGGTGLAIVAALLATLSYGIAANYAKKRLPAKDPMAVATGSQIGAAIVLLPFAIISWPQSPISAQAWVSVIVMGVASTGIAYILYFRLIANVGPAKAIAVTFLIPVFAVAWGYVFLYEALTTQMIVGAAIVLLGTAISTGVLPSPDRLGGERSA